jgi:ATP-dependent DNA helicase RecQ
VATLSQLRQRLRAHFGFHDFRPGQAQAVRSAIAGRDVLAIMPTGSGKSLCFQLPALELDGVTVVVSPLIALMKDQADRLAERGIAVAVVNSTLNATAERAACNAIAAGEVDFIYTTPERMAKTEFRDLLKKQPIDLFVADEAHCISQWGHDFRPDYLSLGAAIDDLGRPPVLAFTATATQDVIDDIRLQLRIPECEVVHTGFHRPNISLAVVPCSTEADKRAYLAKQIRQASGAGIVYVATVKAVDELTSHLQNEGFAVEAYHGRLAAKRRTAAQDRFMASELQAIVATNAFGLGIDKPDIRFVTHYHVPGTLEAFYQEFGRAGRDGAPALGTLLYHRDDQRLQKFFQGGRTVDDGDLVNAYHALEQFEQPPSFDELNAACPLSPTRLRHCLAIFTARNIVQADQREGLQLLQRGLARDSIARAAEAYKDRQHREQLKLAQMMEYAERGTCRWRRILDYFGSDELGDQPCGHCDCCATAAVAVA